MKTNYVVIAIGGRPNYEAVPGSRELAITSDDLFWLQKPPGKTLVVGGSYVALECAGFLSQLGYPTSLMVRSVLLRGYDQGMATRVGEYMERHGVRFFRETIPTLLEKASGRVLVHYRDLHTAEETSEEFDTVLLAIGRRATTDSLGLDRVGIKAEINGKIRVNEREQTSVPNIFAVGDVVFGRPELSPVAIKAGRLLAARLAGKGSELMDYYNIPSTVYTPLEYGFCGYSEEAAIERFGKDGVTIYFNEFKPVEWSYLPIREKDVCYLKFVVHKASDRVIGFHYLGPNAGEVTQGYAVGIKLGVTKSQWDRTLGVYPTLSEVHLQDNEIGQSHKKAPSPKRKCC